MTESSVTISLGADTAALPEGRTIVNGDVETAARAADVYLDAAKAQGRDRVVPELLGDGDFEEVAVSAPSAPGSVPLV